MILTGGAVQLPQTPPRSPCLSQAPPSSSGGEGPAKMEAMEVAATRPPDPQWSEP